MSLIYSEYLVNVHSSDIPHAFIPHFTLHSAEKIRIRFSANYPLTTFRIPHSAKYPFPALAASVNSVKTTAVHTQYVVAILNDSETLLFNASHLWSQNEFMIFCCMQEEPQRADSYRYAVQPQLTSDNRAERIEALQRKRKLKKTKEELESLKDELDMVSNELFLQLTVW